MKAWILLLILGYNTLSAIKAQNVAYTKTVIDTLTSPYFSGRGAVNDGEIKAAAYLYRQYKRMGLKAYNDSYYQRFNYTINTFPRRMEVSIDNKSLTPGVDFIVDPASGGVGGNYKLIWYNSKNVPTYKQLKKLSNRRFFTKCFIVIDDEGVEQDNEVFNLLRVNAFGAAGLIFLEDKLTQSLAPTYHDYGILHVLEEKISRENRAIEIELDHKFIQQKKSQNVIGYVKGSEHPDSVIVLSAHYDHLGMMGEKTYFPGANDNASGVAMLLNLAYHYTHKELPKKTIVFACFGAEEVGILGSKYFVENPLVPLKSINFVMNMDLMGTGEDGATIVNATILPKQFELLDSINTENDYLFQLKKRGKAASSDHHWFTEAGIPAFFIYLMGGIDAYHDVFDQSATLPLTEFEDSFRLIRDFVDEL